MNIRRIVPIALAPLLVLAACGDDDDEVATDATAVDESLAPDTAAVDTTAASTNAKTAAAAEKLTTYGMKYGKDTTTTNLPDVLEATVTSVDGVPLPLEADGEFLGTFERIEFAVAPRALHVI